MAEGIFFPAFDADGVQKAVYRLTRGGGYRSASHNFCDPCSWWQESVHASEVATTDDGAQTSYTIDGTAKIVDLRHGRVTFEDVITVETVAPNGNTMDDVVPTVSVDGVAIDLANEDATSGGDRYTIDYPNRKIVFGVARDPNAVVTITCRRAASSRYTWVPPDNQKLSLEDAEVDVTEDIDMTASIITTGYGSHTVLTGGQVVALETRSYKKFADFHRLAREFYGPIPGNFGGSGGYGNVNAWTFKWQYVRADVFFSTPGYRKSVV